MRWERVFCFALLLFVLPVQASMLSSIVLSEAQQLVEIEPERAKYLAETYLTQRALSNNNDKSPSAISREDADRTLRTPNGSVEAHKILAQAEFALGNIQAAEHNLDQAEELAQIYNLHYLLLDLKLMRTKLVWRHDQNHAAAQAKLANIQQELAKSDAKLRLTDNIRYRLLMQQAEIASKQNDQDAALAHFTEAKTLISKHRTGKVWIDYHLALGTFYLEQQQFNLALSELLFAYWTAVEANESARLAKVNRQLANLFQERNVYDKALEYLSQAADFYDTYPTSPILSQVMEQMGNLYFQKGKFNLALVHYFSVLDHASTERDLPQAIAIRQNLAATYLQLFNFPMAEQYLDRACELLEGEDLPKLQANASLLQAGLAYFKNDPKTVLAKGQEALGILDSLEKSSPFIRQNAYRLLALGYEQKGDTSKALENLRQYYTIANQEQEARNHISEEAFRQQKEFAEQNLHYVAQSEQLAEISKEYHKFQNIAFGLFLLSLILFLMWMRKGVLFQRQHEQIESLSNDLYTHSRSRLRNLRMLNAKLSSSLRKANQNFELWQQGELIHEPLNDRLRFAMIDLPFLRSIYTQHGYKAGLKLERAFGEMLNQQISSPARLYHFSDANLLYIEPSNESNNSAEGLFNKVQSWIDEFAKDYPISPIVRMGIADYPFLPRAYTAINDQELLDLLLLATNLAREVSLKDKSSQWVYFKAIDNAPAASLATGDIRSACQTAIHQGLIKIHSSHQNEDNLKKILKNGEY